MDLRRALKQLVKEIRSWTWHHVVVFLLTFFLYAIFHACRKAFSNVKDLLGKSLTPLNNTMYPYDTWQKVRMFDNVVEANVFLGELDFLFLLAYSIGLFVSGTIGDRINIRYMLTVGTMGSALMTLAFGYLPVPYNIHNKLYYRCLFFINGLFQSTGWPALVTIMGNWFSKESSGLVFGIWSSNANIGNMMGSLIVASVIEYGYEYGMLLNSVLSFCGGIAAFCCLIPHPNDIGIITSDQYNDIHRQKIEGVTLTPVVQQTACENKEGANNIETLRKEEEGADEREALRRSGEKRAIKFHEALFIPGVLPYALAYACLKMVNYSFFFWLPTYLSQGLHWNDRISDNLSNFYDVGAIIGCIGAGVVSDFIGYRSPVISLMLVLALGSVLLYQAFGSIFSVNVALMLVNGCLLGGPANTVSTTITADLGKHEKIAGNSKALATVTGIIDGTGSFGAAIGQFLVGVIQRYGGWEWVFRFLVITIGASVSLISPILIKELKSWRHRNTAIQAT